MTISVLEYFFWATGTVLYGALSFASLRKRRLLCAPIFSAWLTEMFVSALVLFVVSRYHNAHLYASTYWFLTSIELLLQIGVAGEFALRSIPHTGPWIPTFSLPLLIGFIAAIVLSCILSFSATPATLVRLDVIYVRVKLFTSLITVFFSFVTFLISQWPGWVWRRLDYSRFCGFVVFASASALVDSLHIYWRTAPNFMNLEIFQLLASQGVLVYWLVLLRRVSPELCHESKQDLEHLRAIFRSI